MDEDFGYDCYERDDDYNVFEENCLDADRMAGEYEDGPPEALEPEAQGWEPEDAWLDGAFETE